MKNSEMKSSLFCPITFLLKLKWTHHGNFLTENMDIISSVEYHLLAQTYPASKLDTYSWKKNYNRI
jgi:hypothetical protein